MPLLYCIFNMYSGGIYILCMEYVHGVYINIWYLYNYTRTDGEFRGLSARWAAPLDGAIALTNTFLYI